LGRVQELGLHGWGYQGKFVFLHAVAEVSDYYEMKPTTVIIFAIVSTGWWWLLPLLAVEVAGMVVLM